MHALPLRFAGVVAATTVYGTTNTFPRLLLVDRCRVLASRNEILSALTNAAFDPRTESSSDPSRA